MELKDAVHRTIGTGGDCIYLYNSNRDYIESLKFRGLWLFSYAYLIQTKRSLDSFFVLDILEPVRKYCSNGSGCRECNKYRMFSYNEELAKEKEKVVKGLIGLCLDCVSTGRESFRTGGCRIKHAF